MGVNKQKTTRGTEKKLADMTTDEFIAWYNRIRSDEHVYDAEDGYIKLAEFIPRCRRQKDGRSLLIAIYAMLPTRELQEQFLNDVYTAGFSNGWTEAVKSGSIDIQPEENLLNEFKDKLTDLFAWKLRLAASQWLRREHTKNLLRGIE